MTHDTTGHIDAKRNATPSVVLLRQSAAGAIAPQVNLWDHWNLRYTLYTVYISIIHKYYVYIHIYICMYVCVYAYYHYYVHMHLQEYIYIYTYIYTYIYIYICTFIYIYIYMWYSPKCPPLLFHIWGFGIAWWCRTCNLLEKSPYSYRRRIKTATGASNTRVFLGFVNPMN